MYIQYSLSIVSFSWRSLPGKSETCDTPTTIMRLFSQREESDKVSRMNARKTWGTLLRSHATSQRLSPLVTPGSASLPAISRLTDSHPAGLTSSELSLTSPLTVSKTYESLGAEGSIAHSCLPAAQWLFRRTLPNCFPSCCAQSVACYANAIKT